MTPPIFTEGAWPPEVTKGVTRKAVSTPSNVWLAFTSLMYITGS